MALQKKYIPFAVFGGILLILGLLWYYQSQGILKIFPSKTDRENKKILTIDESKFAPANGLPEEKFQEAIRKLYEERDKVYADPKNAQAWFDFGYTKQFLNDHEGAVLAWEKSLELQPLNFVTALNLGNTYQYFIKDYHRAEFYYQEALKLQPGYTSAYQGLLDIYRFNIPEKQNQVEPLLLQAIKSDPANQIAYFTALVDFFVSQNNLDKARTYRDYIKSLSAEAAAKVDESYPMLKT